VGYLGTEPGGLWLSRTDSRAPTNDRIDFVKGRWSLGNPAARNLWRSVVRKWDERSHEWPCLIFFTASLAWKELTLKDLLPYRTGSQTALKTIGSDPGALKRDEDIEHVQIIRSRKLVCFAN
jgi:hypothetical protein